MDDVLSVQPGFQPWRALFRSSVYSMTLLHTQVAEIRSISGPRDNLEEQLCAYLKHARARKLPLSVAGTRHTMGGQTFTPGGIILDMLGLHEMELDEQMTVLRVQAGARWSN